MLWTTVRIRAMSRVTEPRGEGTVEELFQGAFSSFVLAPPPTARTHDCHRCPCTPTCDTQMRGHNELSTCATVPIPCKPEHTHR